MAQYEYKCVPAPMGLSVSSTEGESKAIQKFTDSINQNCNDGWEFVSMGQFSVTSVPPAPEPPGCLGGLFILLGLAQPPVREASTTSTYNLLVFRRPK